MVFYLGLASLIGGVYFLLVNLNIINKKPKTEDSKPIEAQKIDNLLVRGASIILCILGIYFMWTERKPQEVKTGNIVTTTVQDNSQTNNNVWTDEMKEIITKQCLDNGKRTAEEYPELVNDYCKCATQKISQEMTPEQYTQCLEKSYEEQGAQIRPIVQTCVDIMTKLIQLSEEAKPELNNTN